jgi:hypothetical protein
MALAVGAVAALVLVWFLVRRPKLTFPIKVLLFFGLFLLPTLAAVLGNVSNLETTKTVEFCGSCHSMTSYVNDARDKGSSTLASKHARLPAHRDEACYGCHADYGMLGGVTTKIGGMRHVWEFYTQDWGTPDHEPPHLYKPYDTRVCMSCHDPLREDAPLEHRVHGERITNREMKCTESGCHGRPHPLWKPKGGL